MAYVTLIYNNQTKIFFFLFIQKVWKSNVNRTLFIIYVFRDWVPLVPLSIRRPASNAIN